MSACEYRTEHDLLGERKIPAAAYYGVHTLRAVENFSITGTPIAAYPDLVGALASVKQAAAVTNLALGLLEAPLAAAIVAACVQVRAGALHDQFVVDVIQGGAGTSTNMNANEVIANLALEKLGLPRGHYHALHPNEHVNLSQSTNDAYPTALRLAAHGGVCRLVDAMEQLKQAFARKAAEFADVLKIGRTQLQDAVPMTLGQEFGSYVTMLAEDQAMLRAAAGMLCEVNLGGTAIGTGINVDPRYAHMVCKALAEITGLPVTLAPNLIAASPDVGAFVHLSSVLKRTALRLSKTCNDLRLLSSGPRAGLGEITLPARQAGSSIMPGKVNPVIPEVVNQVAFEVLGNDVTISFAAEAGQLQLNAFEPVIAHSLFKSLAHLGRACTVLAEHCVDGIEANRDLLRTSVDNSISVITALSPYLGYATATAIAQEALQRGVQVHELILQKQLLSESALNKLLEPAMLTAPRAFDASLA